MKLNSKNFLPLFITQCLNAFNDNAFKNSLILLITYESLSGLGFSSKEIISLASFLFTLPYLLFSSFAGNLSDKSSKDVLARRIKLIEIFIMAISIYAIPQRSIPLFLLLLFFMGMQSAFFSPVKLAMLPELVPSKSLMRANGFFSMGTFFSILFGTAVGGVLVKAFSQNSIYIGLTLTTFSILGYLSSLKIPNLKPQNENLGSEIFFIHNLKRAFGNEAIKHCILFSAWLWFIGMYYMSTLPLIIKNYFFMDESVSTIFMAMFSVGVAIGSLLSSKISKKYSIKNCIFIGLVGMFTFHCIGISFIKEPIIKLSSYGGISELFQNFNAIALLISISLLSVFGGIFVVPQQTLIQMTADPKECARMIAALNIFQAITLLASSLLLFILFRAGYKTHFHFYVLALLYLIVILLIYPRLKHFTHESEKIST